MRLIFVLVCVFQTCYSVDEMDADFKGCYGDDSSNPDLTGPSFMLPDVDLSMCCDLCLRRGYPYCALQRGSKCFCGNNYGRYGPSTGCNSEKCKPLVCGGLSSNSVYYSFSKSHFNKMYNLTLMTRPAEFYEARQICLRQNGELLSPIDRKMLQELSNMASSNDKIWIGLHKRFREDVFEWTEELFKESYARNENAYRDLWKIPVDTSKACVAMDVSTMKWETMDCQNITLPFICKVYEYSEDVEHSHDKFDIPLMNLTESADIDSFQKNTVMLWIVVPLCLCCYVGSCITYCTYKIMNHCGKDALLKKIRAEKKFNHYGDNLKIPVFPTSFTPMDNSDAAAAADKSDDFAENKSPVKSKSISDILIKKMKSQERPRKLSNPKPRPLI